MTILPLTDVRGRGLDIVINNIICGSAGIGRQARLRGVCLTTYGFKSHLPHQTVEIRTLYQSVKGSDFYYILTIQILIVNLNSIKALAFFCKCFSNSLCSFYQMRISLSPEILTNRLVELR